jgi:ubiquinone/menaquinone biosynthesis C-methylase UbiE
MTTPPHFDFGKGAVARSYDDVLVPLIFRPWGQRLLDEHEPWDGRTVLDLATGTGSWRVCLPIVLARTGR